MEPGYCTGSDTYGVESHNVWGLAVTDTDIYECSYRLVTLSQTYDAVFANCKFTENQYWIFMNDVDGEENQNVTFENCVFDENNFFIGIDFWLHTMYNHQCCDARMYVTGPDSSVGRAED